MPFYDADFLLLVNGDNDDRISFAGGGEKYDAPQITLKTVYVAAVGGQGGQVMVDWLFNAAQIEGYVAQAIALPGLSQRGGKHVVLYGVRHVARPRAGCVGVGAGRFLAISHARQR